MDFFETLKKRYSYRGVYTDADIPEADLEKMMDAALRAPSGYNTQTTNFIVVRDAEVRKAIHDIIGAKTTATAPVIIVPVSNHVVINGLCFEIEDYAAATENLILAAAALGYTALWVDGAVRSDNKAARIAKLLNVPKGGTVRAVVPVGIAAEPGQQKEKKPAAERVKYI